MNKETRGRSLLVKKSFVSAVTFSCLESGPELIHVRLTATYVPLNFSEPKSSAITNIVPL